ncbi:MAG: hypothetical protein ACLT8Y_12600 [Dorea formicigenerans]
MPKKLKKLMQNPMRLPRNVAVQRLPNSKKFNRELLKDLLKTTKGVAKKQLLFYT